MRTISASLVVAATLAACLYTPRGGGSSGASQLARIDSARAAWDVSRGPRQAVDYARAVHESLTSGAYQSNPYRWRADLPGAIGALDASTPSAGADAATLIAWRALLLDDNAQPDDALAEYRRSLALGPTLLAGAALARYHGRDGRTADLHAVCGATAPRLLPAERYDLMVVCFEASNALTEEAGLPWASANDLAWYRGEAERRRQVEVARADADRARQQDELRARRDQMMIGKMCRDECAETRYRCSADCGSVARDACEYGCESREKSCLRSCK